MICGQFKFSSAAIGALLLLLISSPVLATEKIIQKESISFERCLKVIITSEDKLSIAPKVTDVSERNRVAVFTLTDGTLTITCDGEEGVVIVSTNK